MPDGVLTQAEHKERSIAGLASAAARHRGHEPSRAAVALFRQGQQRPDRVGRAGVWDTRTSGAEAGRLHGNFVLHFPVAYRGTGLTPLKAREARRAIDASGAGAGGLAVANPRVLVEAHRHPEMAAIMRAAIQVVRDHQKGAIERGVKRGLIPEGTSPAAANLAYKHAALLAIHKAGLGDYSWDPMDEHVKASLTPLRHFMLFAHRRVFDQLNTGALQGKWRPFRDEFGQLHVQRKHGKETGVTRMRMRPNSDFIKLEGDLGDDLDVLEKAVPAVPGARPRQRQMSDHVGLRTSQLVAGAAGGVAAGTLAAHGAIGRAADKVVNRVGDKFHRAAVSRLRLAQRNLPKGAPHPLLGSSEAYTKPVLGYHARVGGAMARGLGRGIARAGIAGLAFSAGDYAGDRIARAVHGEGHKGYRHINALGFGLGTAGAIAAHVMQHGRGGQKLIRRLRFKGKLGLLAAGLGLTAATEAAGTRAQDRTEHAISHAFKQAPPGMLLKRGHDVPREHTGHFASRRGERWGRRLGGVAGFIGGGIIGQRHGHVIGPGIATMGVRAYNAAEGVVHAIARKPLDVGRQAVRLGIIHEFAPMIRQLSGPAQLASVGAGALATLGATAGAALDRAARRRRAASAGKLDAFAAREARVRATRVGMAHVHRAAKDVRLARNADRVARRAFGKIVPPIGGLTKRGEGGLRIAPSSDALLKEDLSYRLGDFNTDPKRQLNRAIRPRLRANRVRLRLNTQRDLRHLLNGGVTRTERWQLGVAAKAEGDVELAKALSLARLMAAARAVRATAHAHLSAAGGAIAAGPIGGAGRAIGRKATAYAPVRNALREGRAMGAGGIHTPVHSIGRIIGAAIGGEKGAKIGGNVARLASYAPLAYSAHGIVARRLSGKPERKPVGKRHEGAILGEADQDALRDHLRVLRGGTPSPAQTRAMARIARRVRGEREPA